VRRFVELNIAHDLDTAYFANIDLRKGVRTRFLISRHPAPSLDLAPDAKRHGSGVFRAIASTTASGSPKAPAEIIPLLSRRWGVSQRIRR
jgi:hypothetical protein